MVDYWAADLLPVTKSSSLMPSSGVLLTRRSERICIMRVCIRAQRTAAVFLLVYLFVHQTVY